MISLRARLTALAFVVAVAGCVADLNGPQISKALTTAKPEMMGMVVASMGTLREDTPYKTYTLEFRDIRSKETVFLPFNAFAVGGTPIDFRDGKADVALFAFQLPEGRYELFNFELSTGGMKINTHRRMKDDISLPFDVKAGQVSYLGEFVSLPVYRQGGTEAFGGIWSVRDQQARDIQRAKQKLPGTSFENVVATIPDVSTLRSSFFIRTIPNERIIIP